MKTKVFIFGIMTLAIFLFGVKTVAAATVDLQCSDLATYTCVDIKNVGNAAACQTNLCSGSGNNIKCCPIAEVKCAADGSTNLQKCSVNGQEGFCNTLGVCATNTENIPSQITTTPRSGGNSCNRGAGGSTTFLNPLCFNTVEEFLGGIMTALQRIIAVIALIAIVWGALLYITSGGGKQTETAKKTIFNALIGMAIAIAAPSFLKEISVLLGWTPNNAAVAGALTLTQIAMRVLNFLLSILGVLALIMMVIGGTLYTTAAGDSKKAETGKNMAQAAIIGVIIAMSSMVILQQVARFFAN